MVTLDCVSNLLNSVNFESKFRSSLKKVCSVKVCVFNGESCATQFSKCFFFFFYVKSKMCAYVPGVDI